MYIISYHIISFHIMSYHIIYDLSVVSAACCDIRTQSTVRVPKIGNLQVFDFILKCQKSFQKLKIIGKNKHLIHQDEGFISFSINICGESRETHNTLHLRTQKLAKSLPYKGIQQVPNKKPQQPRENEAAAPFLKVSFEN